MLFVKESYNSGDIVILNREQVGNPQSSHKDCQIPIPNSMREQCYVIIRGKVFPNNMEIFLIIGWGLAACH